MLHFFGVGRLRPQAVEEVHQAVRDYMPSAQLEAGTLSYVVYRHAEDPTLILFDESEGGHLIRFGLMYQILRTLAGLEFDSLLVVGGGEGFLAHLVRKHFGAEVLSVDLSVEACLRAGELFEVEGAAADGTLSAGSRVRQAITIENIGNAAAYAVVIEEILPRGMRGAAPTLVPDLTTLSGQPVECKALTITGTPARQAASRPQNILSPAPTVTTASIHAPNLGCSIRPLSLKVATPSTSRCIRPTTPL